MPEIFQTKVWQLQIPEGWKVLGGRESELVLVFRPDGVGQLRIFCVPEQPSVRHTSGQPFLGRLPGTTWKASFGSNFSRHWKLSCRGRTIRVNYTCAAEYAELEYAEVDEILKSLEECDAQRSP